jgi:SWIM/SEC-C metal-binding protein
MAKLGTKKRPVKGHVQTLERAQEILAMCDDRGWTAVIGIEPDKPEDIAEVQRLFNPPKPKQAGPKVGRNDPCPCGSGKKFKKCCMAE